MRNKHPKTLLLWSINLLIKPLWHQLTRREIMISSSWGSLKQIHNMRYLKGMWDAGLKSLPGPSGTSTPATPTPRTPDPLLLKQTLINPLHAWGGHSGLLKAVNLNQPLVSWWIPHQTAVTGGVRRVQTSEPVSCGYSASGAVPGQRADRILMNETNRQTNKETEQTVWTLKATAIRKWCV